MRKVLAVPTYCRILVHVKLNCALALSYMGLYKSSIRTKDIGNVEIRKVRLTIIIIIVIDLIWRISFEFLVFVNLHRISALNTRVRIVGIIEKLKRSM